MPDLLHLLLLPPPPLHLMMILDPPPPPLPHLGPELWAGEGAAGEPGPPGGGLRGVAFGQDSSRSSKHTGKLQQYRNINNF